MLARKGRRRRLRFDGVRKAVMYFRRPESRGLMILKGRLTAQGGWIEVTP